MQRGFALVVLALLVWSCGRSEELIVGRLIVASTAGSGGTVVPAGGTGGGGAPAIAGMDAGVMSLAGGAGAPIVEGDASAGAAGAPALSPESSFQPCGTGTGPCPLDEFCSFAGVEPCGAGVTGECIQRPTACPTVCTDPMLCACNGQRYCNECLAQAAGFDVGPDGICQHRHCGSWLGISCSDSEFCDFPDIACGSEVFGNCLPRPDIAVCPQVCDTTCGCDGVEYCTECEAHVAGFDRGDNLCP